MKRVTIKDIAREAQTSYATVSYYLNNRHMKFSDETAQRIESAIKKLGYVPNRAARRLAQKRSFTIGIVLPPSLSLHENSAVIRDNPFYSEFAAGVQTKAWELSYDVVVSPALSPESLFEWIIAYNLDGVILFDSSVAEKLTQEAGRRQYVLNTVLVGLEERGENVHVVVGIDEAQAISEATEYLIALGHTHIAFATGEYDISPVNARRFEGYKRTLLQHSLSLKEEYVLVDEVSLNGGKRIGERILDLQEKEDITAVVCVADILAAGIYKAFFSAGKKIPDHLSVVGFDDLYFAALLEPELTTVHQDIYQRGAECVLAIHHAYEDKESVKIRILPTHLMIRGSVKKRM